MMQITVSGLPPPGLRRRRYILQILQNCNPELSLILRPRRVRTEGSERMQRASPFALSVHIRGAQSQLLQAIARWSRNCRAPFYCAERDAGRCAPHWPIPRLRHNLALSGGALHDHRQNSGPGWSGIGNYSEVEKILPQDYSSLLTRRETREAIFALKRFIEDNLCKQLNLMTVTVPHSGLRVFRIGKRSSSERSPRSEGSLLTRGGTFPPNDLSVACGED